MRPLSLYRPSAWPCAAGPVAADSGLAGAGRGYTPSGEFGAGSLPGRPRQDGHHGGPGSGGGERVVAELGQDVAGLAEDLAGLGEGGALAVLAVLDGGVVAVVAIAPSAGKRTCGLRCSTTTSSPPLVTEPREKGLLTA